MIPVLDLSDDRPIYLMTVVIAVVVAVVPMVVVASTRVLRLASSVVTPRKKGGDRKHDDSGIPPGRAQLPVSLVNRFHDSERGHAWSLDKGARVKPTRPTELPGP
jgi:hypothetical protein